MRSTPPDELVPDEELALRAGGGDREAFSILYERHATGLYDFAARITRDGEAAADVVQTTFTKAWTNLHRSSDVKNVKAWLFAIARNAAIDEVRHRQRERLPGGGEEDDDPFAALAAAEGSDPVSRAQQREAAELVWAAASALGPQEYALLDLHVRRDLGADDIADALGLKKGAVYTRLSRLRDSLEETVTSTLLMRRGRRECAALDGLLTELRATELTREVHSAIRAHLRECERCVESKRRFVSPVEILAGLAPLPLAPGLLDRIWSEVSARIGGEPPPAAGGLVRRIGRASRRSRALAAAALVAVVAGSAAGVLALGSGSAPVEDPFDVRSTTHEVGVASTEPVVVLVWSRVEDAAGYSVEWTHGAEDLPDAETDLPGTSTTTSSLELDPGSWFFHLRTRGEDGRWTSTVHVGPFLIEGGEATPPPDGPLPTLAVEDDLAQEPRSGRATAAFRVMLSAPSSVPVEVRYTTTDGTAQDEKDYRGASGTISLAPGETEGLIEVVVLPDGADEPDETFFVTLADPMNAVLGDRRARGTIVARAVSPDLAIEGTTVLEGDTPGADAVFTLSLSSTSRDRVTADWVTRDGTATGGDDFTGSSGTVSVAPGDTEATVRVPILGDLVDEPDETFSVRLSGGSGARILVAEAVATIRDDDEPGDVDAPRISIEDRSAGEGDVGTSPLAFTVSLSEPSEETVTVDYEVDADSARLGEDVEPGSGTIRFAPGDSSAQVSVRIVGDRIDEPDERFFVTLSGAVGAELADDRAVGTIRDDDARPRASIADASVDEGAGTVALGVDLSGASSRRVTVQYTTTPGTASAGSDYTTTSGTVAFAPGVTTAQVSVPVAGDAVDEPDETFSIDLSGPSGASIADGRAQVTIRDDDQPPVISIENASGPEGTGGTRTFVFSVRLSNPSASAVRVEFAAVAGTALPAQDFVASSGIVSVPPGGTTATISVTVQSDTVIEPDETFSVVLSNPTNATIGDGTGVGTIEDDDGSTPRGSIRARRRSG